MALLKYLRYKNSKQSEIKLPISVSSLSDIELKEVNGRVNRVIESATCVAPAQNHVPVNYNKYTPDQRAMIGRYAAENGPTRAVKHFTKILKMKVPEPTARRLKNEYLDKLNEVYNQRPTPSMSSNNPTSNFQIIKELPTKPQGRPLLLGKKLDQAVQDYINNLRKVGGSVNSLIVLAAANGIVAAKERSLLREHGGHLELTKAWAKSLLQRMGYVKRKCSNAGKVTYTHFDELKEDFLADVKAELLMNDVPRDLVFNWDQTAIQLVPTGEWTMNRAKEKVIAIKNSDDKRQITAVVAATITGELFPVQLLFQGKTERCHPKVKPPEGWDLWHSENHWSNENTMKRYISNIIVPFVNKKREILKVKNSQPAIAIIDGFKGQTTEDVLSLLKSHNIIPVIVPPNCTDKLQPIDVSINKPLKDHVRSKFQAWYSSEVQRQLKTVPLDQVKVEMSAPIMKNHCTNWMISGIQNLQARPEIAINGFKGSGILTAIDSVLA